MPSSLPASRVALGTLHVAAILFALSSRVVAQGSSTIDSVTVAPGVRVPATHAGASRAVVDSNDVKTAAALTFSELMQTRGASVNVLMSGGRLVDGGHFLVRGPSTILTEGAPMLVVDGMRMAEQEDDGASTASRLDDLAIGDIATVEVLRGPGAAALYGAGASAGVIVVTTKQASAGPTRLRMRAVSELRQDAGNYADRYRRRPVGSSSSFSCSLGSAAGHYCVPGALERWNPLADAGIFHNGLGAGTSFDLAGGTRTDDVRLSATTRNASGITRGDRLSQLTSRLNATHRVGAWLELTGRVAYYGNTSLGSIAGEVISAAPYRSVGPAPVDSFSRWAERTLTLPSIDGRLDHVTTGAELTMRPTHWLTLRGASSRDYVSEGAEQIYPPVDLGPGYFNDGSYYFRRSSSRNTHRADRVTGEAPVPLPSSTHAEATLMVGGERERRERRQTADEGYSSGGGSTGELTRNYSNDAMFALGRMQFADRLALNGGVRREKDSGADGQWGVYPTGDVSLRLPLRVLGAEPRLRAAYGEAAQRYALSAQYVVELPLSSTVAFPDAARPRSERMSELEGGIDVDWGSSGGLAFTTYRRTVVNMIQAAPAPPFGGSALTGLDLRSTGVEIDARAAIVRSKLVWWELRGVVATNANRVTSAAFESEIPGAAVVRGYPVGVAQRRPYSFTDANGDGTISADEVTAATSVERLGGSTPTLSMALHSELRFGRSLLLTGIVDRRSGAWTQSGYTRALCWPPEGSCKALQDPTATLADQAQALATMNFAMTPSFDASFTRLRELSLRWTLEPSQARIARAHEVRLVLSGRDLVTWSQWPGPDPEISSSARGSITRNDLGAVPLPRRIMFGVELDF